MRRDVLIPFAVVAPIVATLVLATGACGSRGPLDDAPLADPTPAAADATTDDDVAVEDAAPPTPSVDAGREASVLGCGTCLFGQCSAGILGCAQDAACRTTFQCALTECLASGGSPSPSCLFDCAGGDVSGALKIFRIFQCVTDTCGEDCNGVLSSLLGGLGGGGGGGGGGSDGGRSDGGGGSGEGGASFAAGGRGMTPRLAYATILAPWPTLCGSP